MNEDGVCQLVQCSYARVPRRDRDEKGQTKARLAEFACARRKKADKADREWRVCVCLCVRMSYQRLYCEPRACLGLCECVCECVCVSVVRPVTDVYQTVKE